MALALFACRSAAAASTEVSVTPAECLPKENNAALVADVSPELAGGSVRLYFRRLHPGRMADDGPVEEERSSNRPPAEELYWVEMNPMGDGSYWTVFPKPEDRDQRGLTDLWWGEIRERDWMQDRDWMEESCRLAEGDTQRRRCLEEWLAEQENEAAEYYVGVHDARGELVSRSRMLLVEVREECRVRLNARESGWAANLKVGETVLEQAGKRLFHWLCDGVSSRIDWLGIPRPDDYCRRCVISSVPPVLDTTPS